MAHGGASVFCRWRCQVGHVCEYVCGRCATHTRAEISVERQCETCARMVLETGCPLSIVHLAAFHTERRMRCEAAAAQCAEPIPRQRCAECKAPHDLVAAEDGVLYCAWCWKAVRVSVECFRFRD